MFELHINIMSESAKRLIRFFSDRFLKIDYYPTSLKAILDLDISSFRGISEEDAVKFKKINIETLRDLSTIKVSDYKRLSKKAFIEEPIFKGVLIGSYLIANAWNKRNVYLKKPKMKVVFTGLDYAGKTSLINRLFNDYNYNDMINLEPTIGANIEEFQSDKLDLVLWDLGGQKDHIEEYLSAPENFFVHLDVLIFVFDSQDDLRYDAAVQYFKDIIDILNFLDENPYIEILLNKADSDIVNDPDYQIRVEYLTDKVSNVLMNCPKSWNFDIIPTSIFNFYSNEPEIAKSIKNIFAKEKEENMFIPEIDTKLQRILDINLTLMDKVVSELTEVKRLLQRLAPSDISQSLFSIPFEKVPLEYIKSNTNSSEKHVKGKKRSKFDDDLKRTEQFKGDGPPKRLNELPTPSSQKKLSSEKIDDKMINEIKNTLEPINKSENYSKSLESPQESSKPPMAPKSNFFSLKDLKPPPSPPKILNNKEITGEAVRFQIISELKDIFKQRGLISR